MSDVLHIGEAARHLSVTLEHLQMLEREGCNPSARRDSKARICSGFSLALPYAMDLSRHSRWPVSCEDLAEATL